jgi:hypothetical protein
VIIRLAVDGHWRKGLSGVAHAVAIVPAVAVALSPTQLVELGAGLLDGGQHDRALLGGQPGVMTMVPSSS